METKSLQISIKNGFELINNRHYCEAIEILLEIEKSFPDKTEILKGLGLSYYYLKSYDKAIESFVKYLSFFPDDPKYLSLIANAYLLNANCLKAQDLFIRLLNNKDTVESGSIMKKIFFCIDKNFNDDQSKIPIYEELLRLCPNNPRILSLLSKCFFKEEKYADAYALSKRLVILKPDNPVYAYQHYRNSYAIQEYDEALQVIKPFTAKHPNDYHYAYYVGLCLFGLEQYFEAIDSFLMAHQLFSLKNLKGEWIFFFNIGACYLKLGENEKAEKFLISSINSKPNNPSYYELGNLYYSEEKYSQAKEIYLKILDIEHAKEVENELQSKELIKVPLQNRTIEIKVRKTVRDSSKVREIKKMYNDHCQICGTTITVGKEIFYSEVHHIRPISKIHNGPDSFENMIVLCPNHHTAFDNGCIGISHETKEVFQFSGKGITKIGKFNLLKDHLLSDECIRYYQENMIT